MLSRFLYLSGVSAALVALATQATATQTSSPFNDVQQQSNLIDEVTPDEWPSLRFHFKLKRSSMNFYGQTDFPVFASPIISADGSNVLYDFFATFRDDTSVYNYTLVDGVAYLQSNPLEADTGTVHVQCLRSELNDFPPINSIISALNEAKPVSSLSGNIGGTIRCKSGNIYKVSVSGFDFALCASKNSSFKMYGSDMDIDVEYLDHRVDIVAPTMDADSVENCEVEVLSSPVTSIGRSLLTGKSVPMDESRKLEAEISFFFDDDSCSCKSTPRPCIFIHGLGVKDEMPENEDSLPYWGNNISNHAPCCSSIKFAHLDTVNNSWTKAAQQQKVCNRALAVSNSSTDFTISDTIVVTHSMGSLILAGAIANGWCELNSSSTWVSTAAPLLGSMGSDYAQEVCAGGSNFVVEKIADIKNQCLGGAAMKSVAYENGSYSSPRLNMAYKAVQEVYRTNVSAVMCSESYSGILSSYQANFWLLGHLIPHKSSKNDGTVEFQSCAKGFPESKFGDTYNDRFYRTKLNHYDMQFRGGDAFMNKAKMPVKWFECLL